MVENRENRLPIISGGRIAPRPENLDFRRPFVHQYAQISLQIENRLPTSFYITFGLSKTAETIPIVHL